MMRPARFSNCRDLVARHVPRSLWPSRDSKKNTQQTRAMIQLLGCRVLALIEEASGRYHDFSMAAAVMLLGHDGRLLRRRRLTSLTRPAVADAREDGGKSTNHLTRIDIWERRRNFDEDDCAFVRVHEHQKAGRADQALGPDAAKTDASANDPSHRDHHHVQRGERSDCRRNERELALDVSKARGQEHAPQVTDERDARQ
mmetsp:Transcript_61138/g.162430  ORF Transcript_61138/g.162430 Transcript_61138/m.162430 type:complete len:200 (+) Transcript_61138:255-854(+)